MRVWGGRDAGMGGCHPVERNPAASLGDPPPAPRAAVRRAAVPSCRSPSCRSSVVPQSVVPQSVVPQSVVPQSVVPQSVVPQSVVPHRPTAPLYRRVSPSLGGDFRDDVCLRRNSAWGPASGSAWRLASWRRRVRPLRLTAPPLPPSTATSAFAPPPRSIQGSGGTQGRREKHGAIRGRARGRADPGRGERARSGCGPLREDRNPSSYRDSRRKAQWPPLGDTATAILLDFRDDSGSGRFGARPLGDLDRAASAVVGR